MIAHFTVLLAALLQAPPREQLHRAPTPRLSHAVGYYDPTAQRVFLVGDSAQPRAPAHDRVWSWSGARWELVTESGPVARTSAAAAFDERQGTAVVTGGTRQRRDTAVYESIAESWLGRATSWQSLTATDMSPRDHHSMVYDASRGSVLLFGGSTYGTHGPWPTDTWELGASGWMRIATDGPSGRARSAMVYDSRRGEVVLFGGVGEALDGVQTFHGDTWIWKAGRWRRVATDGPRGRYAHGMVFDARAGVVLMYSGAGAHRGAPLSDMWQWDGSRWTEIALPGPTPGYRYQPVMVYDVARERTVLYGGYGASGSSLYDTWEWNGARWTGAAP
jgi:hypothetical protein